MASQSSSLREEIVRIGAWGICLPTLACWPFLSAMPFFALLGGGTPSAVVTQLLFFVTGFWPLGLALLAAAILSRGPGLSRGLAKRSAGLVIGAYAFAWTVLYGIASLTLG